MSDSKELKCCPFCGSDAEMWYPFFLMGSRNSPATYNAGVKCTKCGCKSEASNPPEESIAAWNRRATQPVVLSDEQINRIAGRNGIYRAMTPDDQTCKSMIKRFVGEILAAKEQA